MQQTVFFLKNIASLAATVLLAAAIGLQELSKYARIGVEAFISACVNSIERGRQFRRFCDREDITTNVKNVFYTVRALVVKLWDILLSHVIPAITSFVYGVWSEHVFPKLVRGNSHAHQWVKGLVEEFPNHGPALKLLNSGVSKVYGASYILGYASMYPALEGQTFTAANPIRFEEPIRLEESNQYVWSVESDNPRVSIDSDAVPAP